MPIWTDATITRFANEGEGILAESLLCICDRESLTIVADTSEYTLGDYILAIRRITWKGKVITPLPFRFYKDHLGSLTSTGTPDYYVFNNIGLNKIKFFPTPNEAVASIGTNLYGSEIPNRVIIDYYRASDSSSFRVPAYLRRRILKAYTLKMCFSLEGKGQNIKAAAYFDKKWKMLLKQFELNLSELASKAPRLVIGSLAGSGRPMSEPVLPVNRYGISVDEGY